MFGIFLFFMGISFAQNPVEMLVDTTNIRIGEQIEYQLSVDKTDSVLFPTLVLDSLRKVEVVEELPIDTTETKFIKKYLLTSFDSGSYVIPRQFVLIKNKKHNTDSLLVHVSTVKVDTLKQKLFPIKAVKNQPIIFDDYKNYVWIGLAILALIIAIILYYVFRKKKEEISIEDRIPPYELAMQRLGKLDEKQLWQHDKIKQYYIELTDIIRTYIERELKIPALESTTDELIDTIKDFNKISTLDLPKETIKNLEKLLSEADLVKFAKHKPAAYEIEGHRSQTEGIINKLKPEDVDLTEDLNVSVASSTSFEKDESSGWNLKRTILAVVYVLFLIFILFVGKTIVRNVLGAQGNILGSQIEELRNTERIRSSYGSPSISVKTPQILKSRLVQVPAQSKSMIDQIAQFDYESIIKGYQINLTTVDFSSNVNEYDLEAGVKGNFQSFEAAGIEIVSLNKEPILVKGVEGIKVIAQLKAVDPVTNKPLMFQMKGAFFGDINGTRTLIVRYKDGDEEGDKIAERIINSIEL